MNPQDLQINTYTSGINCPAEVKAIHLPTGLIVEASGPRYQAEREAVAELERKVDEWERLQT